MSQASDSTAGEETVVVEIDVAKRYDWRPLAEDEQTDALTTTLADGRSAARELVEETTTTTLVVEAETLERLVADARASRSTQNDRSSWTRERLIAQHVEQTVMPHHAPDDAWLAIRVTRGRDRKALEDYLRRRLLGA